MESIANRLHLAQEPIDPRHQPVDLTPDDQEHAEDWLRMLMDYTGTVPVLRLIALVRRFGLENVETWAQSLDQKRRGVK